MAEKEFLSEHLVVCTPLYSPIPVQTFNSFISALGALPQIARHVGVSMIGGTYVQIARRRIAEDVLKRNSESKIEHLLWIDSDTVFSAEDIAKILFVAKKENADIVSGFYVSKQDGIPICYKKGENNSYVPPLKVPENTLFEVDSVGFGFLLMKTGVLEKVVEKYGLEKAFSVVQPETGIDLGEDFVFCELAKKEGYRILVHSGIPVGHAGSVRRPFEGKREA